MRIEIVETQAVLLLVRGDVSALELQARLRDLGYYDGPMEPHPWVATLAALKRFQHDRGLPVTGYPDAETMTQLRESYCF